MASVLRTWPGGEHPHPRRQLRRYLHHLLGVSQQSRPAHVLRTDQAAHRPLPADSDLARAIAILARAQQDAVRDRQQLGNRLRSLLLDDYPAAVTAFAGLNHGGLTRPDARAVLTLARSPAHAADSPAGSCSPR